MSLEEFMKHAADAAYMGDADLLRGYAQQIFKERDEARAEVVSLRRSRKVWNKLLKGAIRQAEARGARRAAATDEREVVVALGGKTEEQSK